MAILGLSLSQILPPVAAAAVGILFSQWVVNHHEKQARKVTAGAKVIGCAAIGGAIGSAVPVIGTGLGLAAGAVVGVIWAWATY